MGSSFGPFAAALLGHVLLIRFGDCSCPSLIGSGFVVVPFGDDFLDSFEILEHRKAIPGLSGASSCTGSSMQGGVATG